LIIAVESVIPGWGTPVGWVIAAAVGAIIGSFLNVCIYRMPREQSIVTPRSRCTGCSHPIAWYDNIPVISYLSLQGRCRHCRAGISWQYPAVELLSVAATFAVLSRFGLTPESLVYLALVYALIVVSFIDLEFQIIPDEISLGGLVLGLLLSLALPSLHHTDSRLVALGRSVLGLLAGGGILYITGTIGDLVFRKETMGGGDVKLLAMAGTVLGWKLVVLTFFLAPLVALVPGLFVLLMKRTNVIPYGPFLSVGLVAALFHGDALIRLSGMDETVRLLWMYFGPHTR
jgi:leader peptidase (prepilin peptidase)/N-methyltransferase